MKTPAFSRGLAKAEPFMDDLIDTFLSSGWTYLPDDPKAIRSRMDFQEKSFKHPRLKPDCMDTELLGRYVVTSTDFNAPGDREIFTESIRVAAQHLEKQLPHIARVEIEDALTTIVAVHESIHWILHVWRNPKGVFLGEISLFDDTSVDFDEGLAQLATRHIVARDSVILEVFDQMCRHQSKPYRIFRELQDYPLRRTIQVLRHPIVLRTQSWELLTQAVHTRSLRSAIKRFIDTTKYGQVFERFCNLLRIDRPDLADGTVGVGDFRGRIMAKRWGM